jgi:protein involved in polysaccharide export with SLBB domain
LGGLPPGINLSAAAASLSSLGVGGGLGLGATALPQTPSIRSSDVPTSAATAPAGPRLSEAQAVGTLYAPPNEFQRFVLETSGYKLPVYGMAYFDNAQFSRSAPTNSPGFGFLDNSPVSGDYLLGVGDQLLIRGWGSVDMDVRATVDRNGAVNIPRVGAVPVLGIKADQAEGVLRKALGKYYKNFEISVTLAGLRGITVYVVGQARRPGSYTLSGVATLSSGLLATGGPGPNGSMRRVQVKRAGQVVKEFDLYAFLARGDSSGDVKLIDGDVIVIPPAVGYVALVGKVNTPAIYELRHANETLADVLEVAGGLPVIADPRRATLERIQPDQSQPRSVIDLALDARGLKTPLKNGDLISVQSVLPEMANAVALRGNVAQPMRMAWKAGLRVRDLIPNKQVLISRDSVRRQNEALFDPAQRERAQRERESLPEDLWSDAELDRRMQRASRLGGRGGWGLQDQAGQVASNAMPLSPPPVAPAAPNTASSPSGAPNSPTPGPAAATQVSGGVDPNRASFAVGSPIPSGSANSGVSLVDTVGQLFDEINWDYAVIERVNRDDLTVKLLPFNLGLVLADANHPDNHLLQPGDVVTVFSANDIRLPLDKRRILVRIEGEVISPGVYQVSPGDTLPELIRKAGGLTHNAYLYGSSLFREEVRRSQIENQAKLLRRLEAESAQQLSVLSQSVGASSDAAVMQARITSAQQAQRQALERVRSIRPEGRISLRLDPSFSNVAVKLPDLKLQNGDRLLVASRPDFVYVYGAVNSESALIYGSGKTVEDYLKQSGMSSGADRNNVILMRADGSALTTEGGWFSRSILNALVMPGDAIVVPDKIDLEAPWSAIVRNSKDFTQIFYQLGLGAAAIKTLRN